MTIEVVLVGIPVVSSIGIGVRVDNGHTSEACRSLEDWQVGCVADELRVVQLNDRLAHEIGAAREVDDGRGSGTAVTALATPVALRDRVVDGSGIVGRAITLCTIVSDVSEDFVGRAVGAEGNGALALDGL